MAEKVSNQIVHPLLLGEISYIHKWKEWRKLWEATPLAEFRHSLLHFGFGVLTEYPEEWVERTCLYLEVADGHKDPWNFKKSEERDDYNFHTALSDQRMTLAGVRQTIARKAFTVVSQNFFKNSAKLVHEKPSWVDAVVIPEVLEKVLWFFRLSDRGRISNLGLEDGEDIYSKTARRFLLDLCEFSWRFDYFGNLGNYRIEEYGRIREIFRSYRSRLIEVLYGLGRLDRLLRFGCELDELCLTKLEELATSRVVSFPSASSYSSEHRRPKTLEEACFGLSPAAEVLILLRIREKEKQRFSQIRELREKRESAEEALKNLTS